MARVAIISIVYEPDVVSTSTMVAGMARGLHDLGHDVTVLSSVPHFNPPISRRKGRAPFSVSDEQGVTVVRCYAPKKVSGIRRRALGLAIFHLTLTLAVIYRARRAEVALVVSPPLTLAIPAFLLKMIGGTRIIYNAQELWPDVPRDLGVITNRLVIALLGGAERLIYRNADAITAIGEGFASVVIARGARRENVEVIPNFVDTTWISPRPKHSELSRSWGVQDKPVVLYAGNLGLTQDWDLLLRAAIALPDVEFVIVGSGAARPHLEAMVYEQGPRNLQMHDFVPREKVADLYGLSDVIVVPLKDGHDRTTTPSKIFSAMASGKPLVACAAPDTDLAREIMSAAAGVVVPPGDLDGLIEGIQRLLGGRDRSWCRESALQAAAMHSPQAVAGSYDRLVSRLVLSRTSR